MRRRLLLAMAVAMLAGVLGAAPAAAGRFPTAPRGPEYLALGDSVAFGIGASDRETTAYVPILAGELRQHRRCWPSVRSSCRRLTLNNLARSGATTSSLIADPEQLTAAVRELRSRNRDFDPRNDVRVVTIDIGGNDAFAVVPDCLDPATARCQESVRTKLATFEANFTLILRKLRRAAGPFTRIVAMTYYNPLPACFLAALTPLGDAVLEGGTPLADQGLNDLIRSISARYRVRVAETYGKLAPSDLVGGLDCLHPNDAGHQIIADAFATALRLRRPDPAV
jgi:lysophospholipase L1-like esterase